MVVPSLVMHAEEIWDLELAGTEAASVEEKHLDPVLVEVDQILRSSLVEVAADRSDLETSAADKAWCMSVLVGRRQESLVLRLLQSGVALVVDAAVAVFVVLVLLIATDLAVAAVSEIASDLASVLQLCDSVSAVVVEFEH